MSGQVDYSLYLVTDSTDAILGSRDLVDVVEQALQGGRLHFPLSLPVPIPASCSENYQLTTDAGVTIVQYRDKTSDTGNLIATAT